mmetsp:Transcript_66036/g.196478  ORF Transcript_66036/g.196478 Transcript_66036/m.196478 type:complete len:249 (+) Transcript_66036:967-1713(+)
MRWGRRGPGGWTPPGPRARSWPSWRRRGASCTICRSPRVTATSLLSSWPARRTSPAVRPHPRSSTAIPRRRSLRPRRERSSTAARNWAPSSLSWRRGIHGTSSSSSPRSRTSPALCGRSCVPGGRASSHSAVRGSTWASLRTGSAGPRGSWRPARPPGRPWTRPPQGVSPSGSTTATTSSSSSHASWRPAGRPLPWLATSATLSWKYGYSLRAHANRPRCAWPRRRDGCASLAHGSTRPAQSPPCPRR